MSFRLVSQAIVCPYGAESDLKLSFCVENERALSRRMEQISFRSASEFQTLISQSKNPLPPLAQFLHSLLVGVRGPSFFREFQSKQ
ncbi:hypothetical protein SDJN03_24669, partial [Cucurbita argyrosperma subsp. sororia]